MNKTKIRRVALALLTGELTKRKRPIGYNQRTYHGDDRPDMSGHSCGTVCCIAGWTTALYAPRIRSCCGPKARKILGLTATQARNLFAGAPFGCFNLREPTNKDAAMVLFHLAETGKVNWEIVK